MLSVSWKGTFVNDVEKKVFYLTITVGSLEDAYREIRDYHESLSDNGWVMVDNEITEIKIL